MGGRHSLAELMIALGMVTAALVAAVSLIVLRPAAPVSAPAALPAVTTPPAPGNVKGSMAAPVEIEEWGDFQ